MGRTSDIDRLTCFDHNWSPPPGQPKLDTGQSPPSRAIVAPQADKKQPGDDKATGKSWVDDRYRLEIGGGYGFGRYRGSVGTISSGLSIDSFIASSGRTLRAAVWDDRLLGAHLSLGLEYMKLHATARMDANFVLFSPSVANVRADATANLYYLNLAFRPGSDPDYHPFIGGGLGAGRARLRTSYDVAGNLLNGNHAHETTSSYAAAAQLFGGVDVDLGAGFYLSPMLRVQYFTTHPVGKPHEYIQSDLDLSLGYKF